MDNFETSKQQEWKTFLEFGHVDVFVNCNPDESWVKEIKFIAIGHDFFLNIYPRDEKTNQQVMEKLGGCNFALDCGRFLSVRGDRKMLVYALKCINKHYPSFERYSNQIVDKINIKLSDSYTEVPDWVLIGQSAGVFCYEDNKQYSFYLEYYCTQRASSLGKIIIQYCSSEGYQLKMQGKAQSEKKYESKDFGVLLDDLQKKPESAQVGRRVQEDLVQLLAKKAIELSTVTTSPQHFTSIAPSLQSLASLPDQTASKAHPSYRDALVNGKRM